jgi:hypothetical protein
VSYTVCTIREVGDGPDELADGLIYPVPLEQADSVAVEPRDGDDVKSLICTAVEIRIAGAKKPMLSVQKIRARVLLTDARLTFACSKFDKGGGWWGIGAGALVAIPANVGSKALAARRRRGKMLVGQIRYPWIKSVYAQNKGGWNAVKMLRVLVNAGGNQEFRVNLTLPSDVDATAAGTELIRRAAAFRLAHDEGEFGEEERARLTELASVDPLVWVKGTGQMAGEVFPTSWGPGEKTASFGLHGGERST